MEKGESLAESAGTVKPTAAGLTHKPESPAQGLPAPAPLPSQPDEGSWRLASAPRHAESKLPDLQAAPHAGRLPRPPACITGLRPARQEARQGWAQVHFPCFCEWAGCLRRGPKHSDRAEGIAGFGCRINYEIV